jgi:hypothetical protein
MRPSERSDVFWAWRSVTLPFTGIPSEQRLKADLVVVKDFLKRVAGGDKNLITCLGLNTSRTMSLSYRMKLLEPYERWLHWALRFHSKKNRSAVPKGVPLVVGAFRIGDVGIVGLPCEPFLGIGRQIRSSGGLPLMIPAGYMNDGEFYVPDSPNVGDNDYQSSFYRFTTAFLPFRKPGGDLLASAGIRLIRQGIPRN